MPALADYLKGTLDDSLKAVVQPAGLIPGALFVLLNLAFVIPAADAREVAFVDAFSGLPNGSKIVVVAVLILLIGYLLLSSVGAVLDTLAGRSWNTSLLATVRCALRNWRRTRLTKRIEATPHDDLEDKSDLEWRLQTRFANADDRCAPTALGDVLGAYDRSVQDRFGLRLAALWEPLRAVVKDDDPAATAVSNAKSSLDLTANLTFVGALFIFEAVVLFSLWDRPASVLLALAGLLLVYVAYEVTVARTVSWCDAIDTVLTLYVDDLLEKMGTRKTVSLADRREMLAKLSEFLLRKGPSDGIFEAPVPPAPTVTASDGIEVQTTVAARREPARAKDKCSVHRDLFDVVLIVSREARPGLLLSQPAVLVFSDPRLPRLSDPATQEAATSEILHESGREAVERLVWRLSSLRPGEGRVVRFALDRWRLSIDSGLKLSVEYLESDDDVFNVTVYNDTDHEVAATLRGFHCEDHTTGALRPLNPSSLIEVASNETGRAWMRKFESGESRLTLHLVPYVTRAASTA